MRRCVPPSVLDAGYASGVRWTVRLGLLCAVLSGCEARPDAALPLVRPTDMDRAAAALNPDELSALRLSRECEADDMASCQRLGALYLVFTYAPR